MLERDDIFPHLLHPFADEDELLRAVDDLHRALTSERDRLRDYVIDPRLVSAYAAFWLPTHLPRLAPVLDWLRPRLEPDAPALLDAQLVDAGAGPGTFSLAWRLLGGTRAPVLLEGSPVMRAQAERLWRGLFAEPPRFRLDQADVGVPRLLLFGHAVNEMGAEAAAALVEQVDPTLVLVLEPGTPQAFAAVLALRERLLGGGWSTVFPCLADATCPWASSAREWCHQYLDVRHPPWLERLSQRARRDRRAVPVVAHAWRRQPTPTPPPGAARLVRVRPPLKHALSWEGCLRDGDALTVRALEVPLSSIPKPERRTAAALQPGDMARVAVQKELATGWRVTLRTDASADRTDGPGAP